MRTLALLVLSLTAAMPATASVVLSGTRIVYPAQEREVTLQIENKGTLPALVQSWLDDGDAESAPENTRAPFILLPPIARIEPGQAQALRIMYNGSSLAKDKETVFYLNVLDVPPNPSSKDGESNNYLQFAYRTRVKMFFRPAGLPGSAESAPEDLKWTVIPSPAGGYTLRADNPTPFHVSFVGVKLQREGHSYLNDEGTYMVSPGGEVTFPLKSGGAAPAAKEAKVTFTYINDFGGYKTLESTPKN